MTDEYAEQPFVLGAGGAADVLATGPGPRRSRRLPVLAGTAVIAVLLAGVGVTAYRTLSGGGPQPEKWAPSSTFAFAKVDFDPAAGQKIAAYRFSRKFPHSPTRKASGPGELKDTLLKELVDSDNSVDYDRDVKPWLGDRAAVAGFTDSRGKPQAIAIVQITDKAKAEAGLRHLKETAPASGRDGAKDQGAYTVHGDYAVVGETQAVVDDATALATKQNLTAHGHYADDIDALGGDQILTGWVDLAAITKAVTDSGVLDNLPFGNLGALGGLGASGRVNSGAAAQVRGRVAFGVHASSDYVELAARTFGVPDTTTPSSGVKDLLTGLPDDTVAALSIGNIGDALHAAFDGNPFLHGMLPQLEQGSGLHLPDDLITVLGDRAVLALGAVPHGGAPPLIALRSHPADAAAARAVVTGLFSDSPDAPIAVQQAGGDLIVASDPAYAAKVKTGGHLGDTSLFRTAMGDLPSSVSVAAFVDLRPLLALAGNGGGDAKALTAVGLVAGRDGSDGVLRLRVVAN